MNQVRITLERLTELMTVIQALLKKLTTPSRSEISELDKEANDLFAQLAEILRNGSWSGAVLCSGGGRFGQGQ
jgi:hypothetical protein